MNCKFCEKPLTKRGKYCDKVCYGLAQRKPENEKICPQCGKGFVHNTKTHCSNKCRIESARVWSDCPQCRKRFSYPQSWPRKYCSKDCFSLAGRASNLGKYNDGEPPIVVNCEYCGNEFTKAHSQYVTTKHHFCSKGCFGKWLTKTRAGILRPEVSGPKPDRRSRKQKACPICKTVFEVKKSHDARRHFCSKGCLSEHQKTLTGPLSNTWKGGRLPYYGPNWRSQKRKARKRDGYICQRCGKTNEEYHRALDVHHIKPFREFGVERYKEANELSNLTSLCNACHKYVEHHGL